MSDEDHPAEKAARRLLAEHGPLLNGKELWQTLGFRSSAAFRQAKLRDVIGVPVFSLPDRRGTFAFTADVADWLRKVGTARSIPPTITEGDAAVT